MVRITHYGPCSDYGIFRVNPGRVALPIRPADLVMTTSPDNRGRRAECAVSDGRGTLLHEQIEWALQYDGYRRLAKTPEKLERVLGPARNSYRSRGNVPDWCGVDMLRGWAFYLARADHHAGGGTLEDEWRDVLSAISTHPHASPAEVPPSESDPGADEALAPGLPSVFSTEPKMHRDPVFLGDKRERLWEPHVAPINAFVNRIAGEVGRSMPYVDPDSGGIHARVLFLLESPATPAALGSGMLSADNDDETAKNIWHGYREAGMPRTYGLHWNAVPWYVGTGLKNQAVTPTDIRRGWPYLLELLDLAPQVVAIVAFGLTAKRSVEGLQGELGGRGIEIITSIHPSPRNYNSRRARTIREVRAAFETALARATPD